MLKIQNMGFPLRGGTKIVCVLLFGKQQSRRNDNIQGVFKEYMFKSYRIDIIKTIHVFLLLQQEHKFRIYIELLN